MSILELFQHPNVSYTNLNLNSLEIKGVAVTPSISGEYNAGITLTNATNFSDTSGGTQYYNVNDMYTIFGEFKCDLAAVDNMTFAIDLVPGTTNSLAKRSIQCMSHRNGSQGFLTDFDSNISPSRLSIKMQATAPATKAGVFFFYTITYRNV